MELRRRGWTVTLASPSRMQKHIAAGIAEAQAESNSSALVPLAYMNLGDCAAIAELTETLQRAADHENYMESQRTHTHMGAGVMRDASTATGQR